MKKIYGPIAGLIAYLSLPVVAFAAATADPCTSAGDGTIAKTLCNLGGENIGKTIRNVIVFFVIVAVVIALIYLLYGGIKWITSRGDKTEVEAARNHIVAALIGLVVVFLAVFLLSIVLSVFGIQFSQLVIPTISE